ncbi:MAG: YitT family protein [Anaerovoracaceae bacterium]|nr:YitT family protein [Anaerovoracaceae bacterium]
MKNSTQQIIRILMVIGGNVIYALTVQLFLLPGNLITGGSTGIALAVHHILGLPVSATVMVFNVAMLIVGFLLLGKAFALTTILSTFTYPIALELLGRILPTGGLTDDVLLCTIFSGLGIGIAVGVVIRAGASTGGMDIPPLVLQKFFRIPVSASLYVFDTCILLMQAMFSDMTRILYGILLVMIYTMVIDRLMLMGTTQTEVKIISSRSEEIRQAVLEQLDRGITLLDGRTGYLGQEMEMIFTVISNRELPRIEKIVHAIDPECFMVVSKISQVSGRGFSMKKEYR